MISALSLSPAASGTVETRELDLVDQADVQTVWSATISETSHQLPEGMDFPSEAPPLFQNTDEGYVNVFERGLFESVIRHYWRCAWLAEAADSSAEPASDQVRAGAETPNSDDELNRFVETLPQESVGEFSTYQSEIREAAASSGSSPEQVEYEMDCEGLKW
ncbi:hypothetical protein [Microbacterium plantarum]